MKRISQTGRSAGGGGAGAALPTADEGAPSLRRRALVLFLAVALLLALYTLRDTGALLVTAGRNPATAEARTHVVDAVAEARTRAAAAADYERPSWIPAQRVLHAAA
jgi:hypothetical protein